jgi:hypothetical protein
MKDLSQTRWTCTRCWQTGTVAYNSSADVWSVFQLLIRAHFAASPDCQFYEDKVRVQLLPAALPDQHGPEGEGRTK